MTYNINKSTYEELIQIVGINSALASVIIRGRPYETYEQVRELAGVGKKKLAILMKYTHLDDNLDTSNKALELCKNKKKVSKERIPSALKNLVWKTYASSDQIKANCFCCILNEISIDNFHCGHVKNEKNGGNTTLENLRPICGHCNSSMGQQHMFEFIEQYGFWRNAVRKELELIIYSSVEEYMKMKMKS